MEGADCCGVRGCEIGEVERGDGAMYIEVMVRALVCTILASSRKEPVPSRSKVQNHLPAANFQIENAPFPSPPSNLPSFHRHPNIYISPIYPTSLPSTPPPSLFHKRTQNSLFHPSLSLPLLLPPPLLQTLSDIPNLIHTFPLPRHLSGTPGIITKLL